MPELITWAGRTLSGSDRFGEWAVTGDLEGWWDSPEVKGDTAERPNADGEFDLPVYNQARIVTINGTLRAKGHGQLHEAGSFLTAAMSGRFQVSGHGSVQWADAKRNSGVKFTPVTDTFAQWQVRLKCVDPRKYGNTQSFVGSAPADIAVYHRGNYDAHPTVVLRGSAPSGYDLWGPDGARFTVTRPLVTGAPHRIEFNDGGLRVDGVLMPNAGQSDVWAVPAGQVTTFGVSTASGSVEATITITDTFI